MIEQALGLPIDIHGGGIDLVFPHHENEIAQGVCAHGHAHGDQAHDEYARYWMHNGFLTVDAEKMSKSIGNVLLLHDLVQAMPGELEPIKAAAVVSPTSQRQAVRIPTV